MKARIKDYAMCAAFWVCVGAIAFAASGGSTACEPPITKQLMEKVWPR